MELDFLISNLEATRTDRQYVEMADNESNYLSLKELGELHYEMLHACRKNNEAEHNHFTETSRKRTFSINITTEETKLRTHD